MEYKIIVGQAPTLFFYPGIVIISLGLVTPQRFFLIELFYVQFSSISSFLSGYYQYYIENFVRLELQTSNVRF